jgi:drug/metabolite transporter (DMT)-like permease
MKWALVAAVVGCTVASDVLQSYEMKRQGEIRDFRPGALGRLVTSFARRKLLIIAVLFMAMSFFSFTRLLATADLSFAVPATAATYVIETVLASVILKERVLARRWAGAVLVACGVAMLAQ